jgi:hypothetical protein
MIKSTIKSNDLIGNRTHDLPAQAVRPEMIGRKWSPLKVRNSPCIYYDGLTKATKYLNVGS